MAERDWQYAVLRDLGIAGSGLTSTTADGPGAIPLGGPPSSWGASGRDAG